MNSISQLLIVSSLITCFWGCSKSNDQQSTSVATPATEEVIVVPEPAKEKPVPAPTNVPVTAAEQLAAVHQALQDGKKILAVRHYRNLHERLPIAGAKLGVEIEAFNLGLPSLEGVRRDLWAGKDDDAFVKLASVYPSTNEAKRREIFTSLKTKVELGTEAAVNARVLEGDLQQALFAAHRLDPEAPIPGLTRELELKINAAKK